MIAHGYLLRQAALFLQVVLIGLLPHTIAQADEIRPALLELVERDGGWVDTTWKVPMKGDRVLALRPELPDFFAPAVPPAGRQVAGAWVEYGSSRTDGRALTGSTLSIAGLAGLSTEVLLRVSLLDGSEHSAILRADTPSFTIPPQPTKTEIAVSYWRMGTAHILEGFDHLLFLATLLLLVNGLWPLIKTVTAFTVAHSQTLVLATVGLINIPSAPTEAVIALSILLLAVEALRKGQGEVTLAERFPWLIAFTFGLVHGLGFAGALSEIGVPQNEVPLALLMFNVGVETGQLLFVVVVSSLLAAWARISRGSSALVARSAPYAIGGIAAFWTLQRVGSFL